jgi:hypothetical protein
MALVYTEQDFNGNIDTYYYKYDYFTVRAATLAPGMAAYRTSKILIAGCGYGFLVQELMQFHGFTDVWGCDASEYAVTTGKLELAPEYRHRILLGDILSSQSMLSVAQQAGLTGGNPRFRGIVTEDVLPCLTQAEVPTALSVLRSRIQGANPVHLITPKMDSYSPAHGQQHPGFLWLTGAQWRGLIGPADPIILLPSLAQVP